jgi:hypothetical protein
MNMNINIRNRSERSRNNSLLSTVPLTVDPASAI